MGSISVSPTTQTTLQTALNQALTSYTTTHPLSKKSHDEACQYMPGGNTRTVLHTTPFPLTISSARSCHLTTIDAHTYVDFLGEYTAGIYGHSHPSIRAAIETAMNRGWNYGAHSAIEQTLAKSICTRFPTIQKVRFVNSGTEANMMALATALAVAHDTPSKTKILIFEKAYHGSTISGKPTSPSKPTINLPHDFILAKYNDIEGTNHLISSLPPNSLAAILVEPMLGSGGCYPATPSFLSTLRHLANEQNALLIFDEVMTSRLSYHGLAHTYNITPDLTTLGKYLGGGMSFGAFGGRDEIMSLFDPRTGTLDHPGTFNNNVFSMHAGVAGSQILTVEVLDELNERGDRMRSAIEDVLRAHKLYEGCTVPDAPLTDDSVHRIDNPNHPPKMFVKGVGSLMCVHFAGPEREMLGGLFWHHMLDSGIYLAQRGFVALSIEIGEEEVRRFVGAVEGFVGVWEGVLRW
ncbi:hypothetical protein OHC33_003344 [Knufia fluminis]|uniref:Uncharacterized protein n=1 Tax=Knufia fluminis TaxID=191047 RepID=A0AAN8EP32_9EURO|nr:hypothetical protein OHC33_003344 [Knufia fluminis]